METCGAHRSGRPSLQDASGRSGEDGAPIPRGSRAAATNFSADGGYFRKASRWRALQATRQSRYWACTDTAKTARLVRRRLVRDYRRRAHVSQATILVAMRALSAKPRISQFANGSKACRPGAAARKRPNVHHRPVRAFKYTSKVLNIKFIIIGI
jgi:hypothetical protein